MNRPDAGGGQRTGARGYRDQHLEYTTATPIDTLLPRLDAVRQTAPDRWIARCPAHDDRHPSLSVKQTADGTWLLKCWAGCGTAEVVAAVGLSLADLFPPREDIPHRRPDRRAWNPRDVLRCLAMEARIAALTAADLAQGTPLSDEDRTRLFLAANRLSDAVTTVEGMR